MRRASTLRLGAPSAFLATPGQPKTALGRAIDIAIRAAAEALIAAPRLTELDQVVGDGDLGLSLARGAQAVQEGRSSYRLDDPAATLHALGLTLQQTLGSASGALYGVFFLRASARLRTGPPTDPKTWAEARHAGCAGIGELGGAGPGDRAMLDALLPAADTFKAALDAKRPLADALRAAAEAAAAGARATATMPSRRGRSSYLGDRALRRPDVGAEAAAIWLRAIAD
jgi:triose/dihydroxyacetone kinase / FAD-AMP lyase (cyclizing)